MGLRPAQGDEKRLGPATTLFQPSPFPLSSREPVTFFDLRAFRTPQMCVKPLSKTVILSEAPRRSSHTGRFYGAQSKDPRRCLLADAIRSFPATNYRENQKSHKLRAQPRDLQFSRPFVELFSTGPERSGETRGFFFPCSHII
jgi:hypothetical protein